MHALAPVRHRLRSSWRSNPRLVDGLVASLLTAISLLYLPTMSPGPGIAWSSVVLTLLLTGPLAWRRTAPLTVLSVVLPWTMIWFVLGWADTAATSCGVPIALASVALYGSRRATRAAVWLTAGGVVLAVVAAGESFLSYNVVAGAATFAAAWLLGDNLRRRRGDATLLADRAAWLERSREEHARRLILEERAHIARELHDVVAHHVSMIAVQAETGPYLVAEGPERAAAGFAAIGSTARQGMTEMRRLMGVLRDEADGSAALTPQPGAAGIDALLTEARQSGLSVELSVGGKPRPLPAGVDLSAYRIVQEALTNVRKHAGPARAVVVVDYGVDALHVRVIDDGCGSVQADEPGGQGLVGMRERVAMLGGQLHVGPGQDGGFVVAASLPLESA